MPLGPECLATVAVSFGKDSLVTPVAAHLVLNLSQQTGDVRVGTLHLLLGLWSTL